MAKMRGITHMAFTEHDSTIESEQLEELGAAYGIQLFKGIEISAFDKGLGKKVHVLGYQYATTHSLEALCTLVRIRRHNNCLKQIGILKTLGYAIEIEDVMPYAPSGILYKQHIMAWLFQTGQTDGIFGDVYTNIFKNGGPCEFDIAYVSAHDAVKAIVADGGVAVLAHGGQQENFALIPELVDCGLKGLELYHPSHSEEHRGILRQYAKEFDLFLSGGTDYHGTFEKCAVPLDTHLAQEDFVAYLLHHSC